MTYVTSFFRVPTLGKYARSCERLIFCCLIAAYCVVANAAESAVFLSKNVELVNGCVQANRSGKAVFHSSFESNEKTPLQDNYENLLDFEFGKEYKGANSLFITRTKEEDPNAQYPKDTAWNVATNKISLDGVEPGSSYVVRITTVASKDLKESSRIGTYCSRVCWYDANGAEIGYKLTPIEAGNLPAQQWFGGVVPENAASYDIQLGFDDPNIEVGDFIVVRSVDLEIVDDSNSYVLPGEFVSGVFPGGNFSWDADVPEGAIIRFQISTADYVDDKKDSPAEFFSFVGPDGSDKTFFDEPFSVDAPFVRYKAFLIPNGKATPVLKSVNIGKNVDRNWTSYGGVNPPRVRLVGEYAKPSLKADAPLEFDIADVSYVKRASVKILLDDVDVTSQFIFTQNEANVLHCQGVFPAFEKGLHTAVVEAENVAGLSVSATRCFLIGEAPTTPQITLRDDGVTLIGGEPFFPIGIYGVCEREFNGNDIDEAFRGLKEAGFNFAHSYSMPREDKFLKAAEKYGFKLWSVARIPDERFVEVERHSPAIIAWYLGDDTSYNTTPSELYDYFDSCKAVDPTRLTVQADPVDALKNVSNYRPYVEGTDAFLPETYPVREDGEEAGWNCVAQTVLDVKVCRTDALDANDGPKAIWPIIQYFQGWGWKRFPTYAELRAMSFAALAAGANGITWYTYGGFVEPEKQKFNYGVTTTPERWNNICKIATQINELSPALLEVTEDAIQPKLTIVNGPVKDPYGNDSLVYLVKRRDSKNYLIAVNTTHEPIEVQLEFPKIITLKKPQAMYDESEVAKPSVDGNVLSEKLEGFAVRIYCW